MSKTPTKETFISDIFNKAELNRCPFLHDWLLEKFEELNKVPVNIPRKGVKKGNKIGMPRHKQGFILLQMIYPKLSLKQFSRVYDFNYGTVRNWTNEEDVRGLKTFWTNEFIKLFLKKLFRLIRSKRDRYEEVAQHVSEIRFWRNEDFFTWLDILFSSWSKANSMEPGGDLFFTHHSVVNLIINSYLLNRNFGDAAEHKKFFEESLKFTETTFKTYFDLLGEAIKSGDLKKAAELKNNLEAQIIGEFIPSYRKLITAAYDRNIAKKR